MTAQGQDDDVGSAREKEIKRWDGWNKEIERKEELMEN